MRTELLISNTDNLLKYSGRVVRVVPKVQQVKIKFELNAKKGCGRVVYK